MAGAVDLELNGVPVRAGAPLPVQLIGGGATPGDVNIKQFGGQAVGPAVALSAASDEAQKGELVRAQVTGQDLSAAANSKTVPTSSSLASVVNGLNSNTANALYVNALATGIDGTSGLMRSADVRAIAGTKNSSFTRQGAQLNVAARTQVADQCLEATAAINTGVTLTIPAPGASLRQYIVKIKIQAYYGAALAGAAAPIIVTTGGTAGIPGTPTWNTPTGTAQGNMYDINHEPAFPIEASADNGTVTIICPANASIIWKVTAWWYNG